MYSSLQNDQFFFYVPLKICQTKSDKPGLELSKQILWLKNIW